MARSVQKKAKGKPAPPREPEEINFGLRLKHARQLKGLKLDEVAEKAGCSISMVSKIENGKVNPTIPMLQRMARALDLTIGALMKNADDEGDFVYRRASREAAHTPRLGAAQSIRWEPLIRPAPERILQGNIMVMQPGGQTGGSYSHEGEKFGLVLQGFLEITIEGKTYLLSEGDTVCFRSELRHSYSNPGQVVTKLLWVNTPPTF
jgi:transcriptional regulator with XRE-family HTH domain